jgi:hypothetical protein
MLLMNENQEIEEVFEDLYREMSEIGAAIIRDYELQTTPRRSIERFCLALGLQKDQFKLLQTQARMELRSVLAKRGVNRMGDLPVRLT